LYNIATAVETRLTDSVSIKAYVRFNHDYIIYNCSEGCSGPGDFNLSLMNRHTQDVTVVAECDQDPSGHTSIADRYAAWTARPFPGHNKDVFVRDLQAGLTFRIESTDFADQYFPHTDDEHVVWQDWRDGRREIYMYDLSTGQEVCLTPDGWEQAWPNLRNGIVSWCDYRFSQEWGEMGRCDVYVYEIATGAGRRVTTESKYWMPRFVDSGWMLYGLWIQGMKYKLYAHDLVGDGILTTDGHVIP
jgi:beta propeller repeat protein